MMNITTQYGETTPNIITKAMERAMQIRDASDFKSDQVKSEHAAEEAECIIRQNDASAEYASISGDGSV
jgi:hypothetical protein